MSLNASSLEADLQFWGVMLLMKRSAGATIGKKPKQSLTDNRLFSISH